MALAQHHLEEDEEVEVGAGEVDLVQHLVDIASLASSSHGARRSCKPTRRGMPRWMAGDARTFTAMPRPTGDFTIMAPFGGPPVHGLDASPKGLDKLGRFFRAGTMEVERAAAFAAGNLAVLALSERTEVEVGGLPRQPWVLRVTVAYRRGGSGWRLAHRHADPLHGGVSVVESASLAGREAS